MGALRVLPCPWGPASALPTHKPRGQGLWAPQRAGHPRHRRPAWGSCQCATAWSRGSILTGTGQSSGRQGPAPQSQTPSRLPKCSARPAPCKPRGSVTGRVPGARICNHVPLVQPQTSLGLRPPLPSPDPGLPPPPTAPGAAARRLVRAAFAKICSRTKRQTRLSHSEGDWSQRGAPGGPGGPGRLWGSREGRTAASCRRGCQAGAETGVGARGLLVRACERPSARCSRGTAEPPAPRGPLRFPSQGPGPLLPRPPPGHPRAELSDLPLRSS